MKPWEKAADEPAWIPIVQSIGIILVALAPICDSWGVLWAGIGIAGSVSLIYLTLSAIALWHEWAKPRP